MDSTTHHSRRVRRDAVRGDENLCTRARVWRSGCGLHGSATRPPHARRGPDEPHRSPSSATSTAAEMIDALRQQVDPAHVCLDDGTLGCTGNHRRAWNWHAANTTTDWALILEDDAQPVAGFAEQAAAALSVAPAPIVSFYLGKRYPVEDQDRIRAAIQRRHLLDPAQPPTPRRGLRHAHRAAAQPGAAHLARHRGHRRPHHPLGQDTRSCHHRPTPTRRWPSHADTPTVITAPRTTPARPRRLAHRHTHAVGRQRGDTVT